MLSDLTRQQIEEVSIVPHKPLIICDVDEVVVHFLRGLEEHLAENAMWLDPASLALNGNIKYTATNEPLADEDVWPMLKGFFDARVGNLDPIEGAASALERLSKTADVIMLTNMPHDNRQARIENLQNHGMNYHVLTNTGPKGPAVKALSSTLEHPVIFLDDMTNNLRSVAEACPEVINIHFMQDIRFSRHITDNNEFSLRSDNWKDVEEHIQGHFDQAAQ